MGTTTEPILRTNTEMAKRLGIHLTMASRLRSGKRRPSTGMALQILEDLGVPEDQWPEGLRSFAESGTRQAQFFDRCVFGKAPTGQ